MASQELKRAVEGYRTFINENGIDIEATRAMFEACKVAYLGEKDSVYGREISKIAKTDIENLIFKETQGGTIERLETYCFQNNTMFEHLQLYYDILELEAPYVVDSFFRYIELDEKNPTRRFYSREY